VSADARGFKLVNYSELPYLTLAAIRELKTENDSLRAQLAAMEARLARLEKPRSKAVKKKPAAAVRTKRVPVAKPQS
jgi:hypothetical protein